MTQQENLGNIVPDQRGADATFEVYLPVSPALDGAGATHVARMRGNEASFNEVLAGFVATGSELSKPLRSPIEESELDQVKFALDGVGPAHVESVEQLQA